MEQTNVNNSNRPKSPQVGAMKKWPEEMASTKSYATTAGHIFSLTRRNKVRQKGKVRGLTRDSKTLLDVVAQWPAAPKS